jgi:chromosome segregation ATPase
MSLKQSIRFLVHAIIWFTLVPAWAEDLDDIEADMETAIGESDAAQFEATAAKKRELEERENLERAKEEADQAMVDAKAKEKSATGEIAALESKINKTKAMRIKFEKVTADSRAKIKMLDEKVALKKMDFEKAEAEKAAINLEKLNLEKQLAKGVKEQRELEDKIKKDRDAIKAQSKSLADLKLKQKKSEKGLEKLRAQALKEAEKRQKIQDEVSAVKRKISSVPKKFVFRSPKMDCDVTDAASDGGLVVGQVKKGKPYELHRVIAKRWVELKLGDRLAFAARSCF